MTKEDLIRLLQQVPDGTVVKCRVRVDGQFEDIALDGEYPLNMRGNVLALDDADDPW